MPTYDYRCSTCGESFETVQSIRDDKLAVCPLTGGPAGCTSAGLGEVKRVFSAPGITFKGNGFYKTDHGSRAKGDKSSSTNGDSSSPDKSSADKSSSGSDKSSADKSSTDKSSSSGSSSSPSSSEKSSATASTTSSPSSTSSSSD